MASTGRRRAVLVGIRTYPAISGGFGSDLAGCHNDVARMREGLRTRGFADGDLTVLIDPVAGCACGFCTEDGAQRSGGERVNSPTRAGILAALERLQAESAPGDVAVFYYSGHGSECSGTGLHVGRRFQTFVPHDSGRGEAENRDITDRHVQQWMRQMVDQGVHLTMIFDCCHSGGMADLRSGGEGVRRVAMDERTDADAYHPDVQGDFDRAETGETGGEALAAVVLSGCAAKELSSETDVEGRKHGLFTHHLSRALARPRVAGETWADLFPEIVSGVTGENLAQNPRRGGNGPVFEPGVIDPTDVDPPDVIELAKLAVVIGVDYQPEDGAGADDDRTWFSPLAAPCRDAEEVARVLREEQGYEIVGLSDRRPGPLLGKKATARRIRKVLHRLASVKARTRRECAVVIYFAGHGMTRVDERGEQTGYLIPWDADANDPSTWMAMNDLRDQLVDGIDDPERLAAFGARRPLARLASRHLLLVLDCCFGGAMAYDFYRGSENARRPIYYSEYRRFVEGTAWQLLSSASFNQQALDRDPKSPDQPYSPFAQALIDAWGAGVGEGGSDRILTASELHQHVDRRLKTLGLDVQTPGLADLRPGDGQFIFIEPGYAPTPLPDPPLHPDANPWPGRRPYDSAEAFYGREAATLDLLDAFLAGRVDGHRRLAVTGPSGCGVTSLLRAGLRPILDDPVASRRALRSWARRAERSELLVSRQDLESVRTWATDLDLDFDDSTALARTVREQAIENGWLTAETGHAGASRRVRESLGVPSFDSQGASEADGWPRRVELMKRLERPARLAECLRLWTAEGRLADFMTLPERALPGLVGRFRVLTDVEEVTADTLEASPAADGDLWLCDPLAEVRAGLSAEAWDAVLNRVDLQIVAAVREGADEGAAVGWSRHRVAPPSRAEIRQAIEIPARDRVLRFESERLVLGLIEEASRSRSPLALISTALSHMVERAWHRRGSRDRTLRSVDLNPEAGRRSESDEPRPLTRLMASRAEALYRRFAARGADWRRTVRAAILRTIVLEDARTASRPVRWSEIELADSEMRQRLHDHILPTLIEERLVVADRDGYQLVTDGLLMAWPRIRRWCDRLRGRRRSPQALWRRVRSWETSGFDAGKLAVGDRQILWLQGSRQLNVLERAFLASSELLGLTRWVERLSVHARQSLEHDWTRSALLAAETQEAACLALTRMDELQQDIARVESVGAFEMDGPLSARQVLERAAREIRDSRRLCRWMAAQTLHDVLAATPLSLALTLPEDAAEPLSGLGFEGGALLARFGDRVLAWDPEHPDDGARWLSGSQDLETGAGAVRPRRAHLVGPRQSFPVVPPVRPPIPPRGPHAQPGYDHSVRYYLPGQLKLPPVLRQPPRRLLAHRAVPEFLAFGPRQGWFGFPRWLASATPGESGREIRLWAIDGEGRPVGEPRAVDVEMLDVDRSESSWRLTEVEALPATLAPEDGSTWRLTEMSEERVTIETLAGDFVQELEIPPRSRGKIVESRPLPRPPFAFADATLGWREVQLGPQGGCLALIARDGWAGLWSLPDGVLRWTLTGVSTVTWTAGRLAVGRLDGTVEVHWSEGSWPEEARRPVLLRPRADGMAVETLRFREAGRELLVIRRRVYEPFDLEAHRHRLDLEELGRLCRRHAGRALTEDDLPRQGPRP